MLGKKWQRSATWVNMTITKQPQPINARSLGICASVAQKFKQYRARELVLEPAAFPLFATGLGTLGLLGWRRKRKAQVD
jgi:hypothetical protein